MKETAAAILALFDEFLDSKNITISCMEPDDEYDRFMSGSPPRIYGREFQSLARRVKTLLDKITAEMDASGKMILVGLENGCLIANQNTEPDYPGIDIEFISDAEDEKALSKPRVLIERPKGEGLRILV